MELKDGTADGLSFTFPIAFTKLPVVKCNETNVSVTYERFLYDGYRGLSTTGGNVLFVTRSGDIGTVVTATLYACGY